MRRIILLHRTAVAVAALLALAWAVGRAPPALNPARAVPAPPAPRDWPTLGGTPHRNMVNLRERGLPQTWNVAPDLRHDVLWTAKLGSRSYGGPTVAGGKIYVGTNNGSPRNRRDVGRRRDGKDEPVDKGVVLCFEEATGRFLWQSVHDKLASGQVNDWPREGICSTPFVEGNRLYYVSNRCEVVCATTEGLAAGNEGVKDEEYKGKQSEWLTKYKAKFNNQEPDVYAIYGYEAMKAALAALQKAGTKDREAVRAALIGTKSFELPRRPQADRQGRLERRLAGQEHHARPVG